MAEEVLNVLRAIVAESEEKVLRVIEALEDLSVVRVDPYTFLVDGVSLKFEKYDPSDSFVVRVGDSRVRRRHHTTSMEGWEEAIKDLKRDIRVCREVQDRLEAQSSRNKAIVALRKDYPLEKYDFKVGVPEGGGVRFSLTLKDVAAVREALETLALEEV